QFLCLGLLLLAGRSLTEQVAILAGADDPRRRDLALLAQPRRLVVALEDVALAVGQADHLGAGSLRGHQARLAVAVQPAEALLLFDGLAAVLLLLPLSGLVQLVGFPRPDEGGGDAQGGAFGGESDTGMVVEAPARLAVERPADLLVGPGEVGLGGVLG